MIGPALGSWTFLALVALGTLCAYSLAMKRMLDVEADQDPVLLSAVVYALVGAVASVAWAGGGAAAADLAKLRGSRAAPLLVLSVSCYVVAPYFYFRALKVLPLSQVAILQTLVGVFTLLGGVACGAESFSPLRAGGALLLVTATALVTAGSESRRYSRTFGLLVFAAAFYAAAALADQRLVSSIGLSPACVLTAAFLPPGLLLAAARLARGEASRPALRRALTTRTVYFNAATLGVAYTAVYLSYAAGASASGVTLILAAEVVGVVVGAALFLGERDRLPLRLVSGALAALGVYLVR